MRPRPQSAGGRAPGLLPCSITPHRPSCSSEKARPSPHSLSQAPSEKTEAARQTGGRGGRNHEIIGLWGSAAPRGVASRPGPGKQLPLGPASSSAPSGVWGWKVGPFQDPRNSMTFPFQLPICDSLTAAQACLLMTLFQDGSLRQLFKVINPQLLPITLSRGENLIFRKLS